MDYVERVKKVNALARSLKDNGLAPSMDDAVKMAEERYVSVNIFRDENRDKLDQLDSLPASCFESAEELDKQREYFEKDNIFPSGTVDNIIQKLKAYDDKGLSEKIFGKDDEIAELVRQYLHCS